MMTYQLTGRTEPYVQNILSVFGLEKTAGESDLVVFFNDEKLVIEGEGMYFFSPLFMPEKTGAHAASEGSDINSHLKSGEGISCGEIHPASEGSDINSHLNSNIKIPKNEIKRRLFLYLESVFGVCTGWGILSGVRPVKLASKLLVEESAIILDAHNSSVFQLGAGELTTSNLGVQSSANQVCLQEVTEQKPSTEKIEFEKFAVESFGVEKLSGRRMEPQEMILDSLNFDGKSDVVAELASERVVERLKRKYLLSEENARMLVRVARFENLAVPMPEVDSMSRFWGEKSLEKGSGFSSAKQNETRDSLYISIPFCPTRCSYCSFPMHATNLKGELIPLYFEKLCVEITAVLGKLRTEGRVLDCIYVGGGTPSTLSPAMVRRLGEVLEAGLAATTETPPTDTISLTAATAETDFDGENFGDLKASGIGGRDILSAAGDARNFPHLKRLREFTFEAGRTDTIADELLLALKEIGVSRVSINPQSFSKTALRRAARSREPEEFERAFLAAKKLGFKINSDIILGLAGESPEEYLEGLNYLVSLEPDNITIHALALKRGSITNEQLLSLKHSFSSNEQLGALKHKLTTIETTNESLLSLNRELMTKEYSPSPRSDSILNQDSEFIEHKNFSGSSDDLNCLAADEIAKGFKSQKILQHKKNLEVMLGYQELNREGRRILARAGYLPYYLYRQKKILANMENIGYAKFADREFLRKEDILLDKSADHQLELLDLEGYCLYNSRIMSERCSIFACGTGAVSKIYNPKTDRHRQISNTRSVEDYINNFDKVLEKIK